MIDHGIKTFIKLIKALNFYSNGNRFVKKYDFAKVFKDFNIILTVNDIEQIFNIFCEDTKKLYLNYFKFIDILLNEFISKERINYIRDIYNKIEYYLNYIGHYEVNLEAFKDIYNTKNNYYQYDDRNAIIDFCDNFTGFHFEFYSRKLNGGRDNSFNKNDYNTNFKINIDEFMEFYKMLSFIIEKDDVFKDIIFNEWIKALNLTSNNNDNNKNDKYNYNDNKNNKTNRNDDEYDDYDDYNIKKNNNYPNYVKLKRDLTKSPSSNFHNHNHNHNCNHNHNHKNERNENETNNNYNKIQIIPINNTLKRNLSRDYSKYDQKRIIRHNNSNLFNKSFDNTNRNQNIQKNNNNNDIFNDKSPLEKLTLKLKMRGLRGLMNLHKQFIFTCSHNLSEISFSNFVTILKNQKISLEKDECKQIFLKFRKEHTIFLDFTKFIREFKKPLNEKRLEAVEDAFAKLDADSDDNIFIETIKKKYNPKGDPLLLKGIKNEEEVSTEFLDCFELNYNLLTAVDNQNVTNVVSFEEFANFYEYVSFLYDDDEQFIKLVNDSWDD